LLGRGRYCLILISKGDIPRLRARFLAPTPPQRRLIKPELGPLQPCAVTTLTLNNSSNTFEEDHPGQNFLYVIRNKK
jgi:hypothetical protein